MDNAGKLKEVTFTPEKVRQLKAAYDAAAKAGESVFVFEGQKYWRAYAKYLVEYLEHTMQGGK